MVSIAHRPSVATYHGVQWVFVPDASGQARFVLQPINGSRE